jgi:DNA-binding NarL/FixJ family response regulator
MIRVLIVDDQELVRQGLSGLLATQPDLQIVGEAATGKQAIAQVEALCPDIVLMDIRMPEMDGVVATREICQQFSHPKVLVLTTFDDHEYVSQALQFGAKGYLLKDTPVDDIAIAIRSVYKGYTYLGPGLYEKTLSEPSLAVPPADFPMSPAPIPAEIAELSPRERQVLRLLAQGASNREIAKSLYITEKTVKNYVSQILNHLRFRDRTQAAIFVNSVLNVWDNDQWTE